MPKTGWQGLKLNRRAFWRRIGVAGELIREDVREGSEGVLLHLDVNVVDVTNCQPIPNIYVELWGCNSTVSDPVQSADRPGGEEATHQLTTGASLQGVYTGVVAADNGNGLAAPEEIKNSALRGVQLTNDKGTASFVTIVPGHYIGRTNHLHSRPP